MERLKRFQKKDWSLIAAIVIMVGMVLALGAQGCTPLNKNMIKVSEQHIANTETLVETAKNFLKVWPAHSGLINGALGARMTEMPQQAVEAMIKLDLLADKVDELTDREAGYAIGLAVRMAVDTVKQALKQFAPDILGMLPAFI